MLAYGNDLVAASIIRRKALVSYYNSVFSNDIEARVYNVAEVRSMDAVEVFDRCKELGIKLPSRNNCGCA